MTATVAVSAALSLGVYALSARNGPGVKHVGGGGPRGAGLLPRCTSGQLRISAPKGWGVAAGSLIEDLTLTNTSGVSCSVAGWPTVRRLDRAGHLIPVALSRWVYQETGAAPFRVLRLQPRDAATFPIFGQDWNHAVDRACPNARVIQIRLGVRGGWLSVERSIPACQAWDLGPLVRGRLAPWPTFALSQFRRSTAPARTSP